MIPKLIFKIYFNIQNSQKNPDSRINAKNQYRESIQRINIERRDISRLYGVSAIIYVTPGS
jgi:hypothetical protein